jgi:hypothetical protein
MPSRSIINLEELRHVKPKLHWEEGIFLDEWRVRGGLTNYIELS